MIKQYPLHCAAITQSRLMIVVYRYIALLGVMTIALGLLLSDVTWLAVISTSVLHLLMLEYCLRLVPAPIVDIRFNDVGLVIITKSEGYVSGDISGDSLVCDWLCRLVIKRHGGQGRISQLIWRDMIDQQSYRRLSRVVRIKRRLI